MTKEEALTLALEALEDLRKFGVKQSVALVALREVLAQPEQEPVAQRDDNERGNIRWLFGPQVPDKAFLYTTPPQCPWVGLTGQEKALVASVSLDVHDAVHRTDAKLKEKNT